MEICLGCFYTHSEKFPSVGGGPISMNIPPRKEEGYYAYSLRVEGVLLEWDLMPTRPCPLLGSRQKICPLPMPHDLHLLGS